MKHCIIGAGFSGLPVGKKLLELSLLGLNGIDWDSLWLLTGGVWLMVFMLDWFFPNSCYFR